jgi:hypothetical protein
MTPIRFYHGGAKSTREKQAPTQSGIPRFCAPCGLVPPCGASASVPRSGSREGEASVFQACEYPYHAQPILPPTLYWIGHSRAE